MGALGWVGFRLRYLGARQHLIASLSIALSITAAASESPNAVGPPAPDQSTTTARTQGQTTPSDLAEVVVTGSHIAESTFTTPTPVTVIDSSVIQ
jgi:hypothetical protein